MDQDKGRRGNDRTILPRRLSRPAAILAVAGALLAAPSDAGAPSAKDQQPGRFQPTQQIKADTIVDFPVDI